MKTRIEAKKLSYYINKKPILKDINLCLDEGKFYGVLGPNGSGKTTLLDLLLGLIDKSSGDVLIDGISLESIKRNNLAQIIALVPQNFNITFPYKVQEILEMGRYPFKKRLRGLSSYDYDIIEAAKKSFNLYALDKKDITSLSGGEKQRIAFAKAIIQSTPVIFLDEATSNMDPYYAHFALNEVKKSIKDNKKTVISVFHDMNLAARYCDEIILLKDGNILDKGKTTKCVNNKKHKKVIWY